MFQAEDGIRDLVRSRGLGDVYKRQQIGLHKVVEPAVDHGLGIADLVAGAVILDHLIRPVSYTHLTLPTSDLV